MEMPDVRASDPRPPGAPWAVYCTKCLYLNVFGVDRRLGNTNHQFNTVDRWLSTYYLFGLDT